jgi:Cyclin, N-terminal domain
MFYFFSAGITCLFIASKVEEIYPPKVNEFAYVTDGACTEKAIIDHEIFVLQVILVLNYSALIVIFILYKENLAFFLIVLATQFAYFTLKIVGIHRSQTC